MSVHAWHAELKKLGTLLLDEPMSGHTTLGVGGPARWFFRPAGREQLSRALALIPPNIPLLPIGRGSNLLIADQGFAGVVLDLGSLAEVHAEDRTVMAQAGVRMSKLASFCAERGLSGLEFMATVPGDVGGGVAMNAGAFGQQVSDTLEKIEAIGRDGHAEVVHAGQLSMRYRSCLLPKGSMVLAAWFNLTHADPEQLRQRIRDMRAQRAKTQPLSQANCGSVFKNPPGHFAAALIEQAGLKGLRRGHARISEKHANFIINEGEAKSSDVLFLIRKAQEEVERLYSIRLEPEVCCIGEDA